MPDSIEVVVFEGKEFAEEWPPKNAVMFLLWLQRKLADVPVCHRNEVNIEIGRGWDRGPYIKLSYVDPTAGAQGEFEHSLPGHAVQNPRAAAVIRRASRERHRSFRREVA